MDKAIRKTDKILNDLERRVSEVYSTDPSLRRIEDKYSRYMARVERLTKDDYRRFREAPYGEDRDRLKTVYTARIKALTLENKQYRNMISEFTRIMADVNQRALDLVNAELDEVYTINYNQVAIDCKKAGIEVNGEQDI